VRYPFCNKNDEPDSDADVSLLLLRQLIESLRQERTVKVEVSSAQIQGGRQDQQDRLITRFAEDGTLIVVAADGLGGQPKGEWAADAAASAAAAALYDGISDKSTPGRTTLERAFGAANRAVEALVPAQRWDPPGTTLICGLFRPMKGSAVIGSLGDSYVFRFRGGSFDLMNRDFRTLESVIGTNFSLEPLFVHEDAIQPGDVYVLATDGIDTISLRELRAQATLFSNARICIEAVIKAVIDAGAAHQDNVSLAVVRVFE
jgi:serine/threonine protein phosphatase PrpC